MAGLGKCVIRSTECVITFRCTPCRYSTTGFTTGSGKVASAQCSSLRYAPAHSRLRFSAPKECAAGHSLTRAGPSASVQDERTGKKVALKLSTKPLATLRDDQHPKDIKAPEFVRELYRTSWDYRCARAVPAAHSTLGPPAAGAHAGCSLLVARRCFCSENEAFGKLNCTDARISEHGLPRLYDSGLVVISGIRVHSFLVMSLLGE